ncbi:MAG TPA: AraC family transcriptional regulator [Rudaea sp.]|nr:AraC family transcriptional regulator [Rudaea sp.]
MHSVPLQFDAPSDRAEFRRPTREGVELYRAHIVRHAFEPHTHDAYGIGAIESGAERFRYAGSEHVATAGSVVLMHPDMLHTGRAASESGWRYRMIYIEEDRLGEIAGGTWRFPHAVVHGDPALARGVSTLLQTLWQAQEPLAFDSALAELIAVLHPYALGPRSARTEARARFDRVIEYMHAHLGERLRLEDLAAVAQLSPFHFLRSFRAQHHATPQQALMALRLAAAKRRLASGEVPAEVAAATGLADQAHLTRSFARRYGVTPARYQRQLRG